MPFVVFLYFGLDLLGLLLFALLHQHAYLFGETVAPGAAFVAFALKGALFRVEGYHLVDEGQFFILKFLFYVLPHAVGIFP